MTVDGVRTILPYTLEEAYEVAEAIENDDMERLWETVKSEER